MKKDENKNKNAGGSARIMIITAIVLLAFSLLCVIYLVLDAAGVVSSIAGSFKKPDEVTTEEDTTAPAATESHAEIETETNADGTPKKKIFYKDNVYNGSIDYIYNDEQGYVVEMYYDADDKLIESIKYVVNTKGMVVTESHSLNNHVFLLVEYTYYDDNTTLWQKKSVNNETETEIVTKERYDEAGKLLEKLVYENEVKTSHTVYTYDSEGNLAGTEEVK